MNETKYKVKIEWDLLAFDDPQARLNAMIFIKSALQGIKETLTIPEEDIKIKLQRMIPRNPPVDVPLRLKG